MNEQNRYALKGQKASSLGQRPGYQETHNINTLKGQKQTDELFAELHRVYQQIEALPKLFSMDEQKVMNEVRHQIVWLNRHGSSGVSPDTDRFVREVYADMGLKDSAEVVFSLTYAVVTIVNQPPLDLHDDTIARLRQLNQESRCGRLVDNFILALKRSGKSFSYRFAPDSQTPIPYAEESDSEGTTYAKEASFCGDSPGKPRTFTLDAIVDYAQRNLSLDASQTIQNMLYRLLSEDGTEDERAKVASIPEAIEKRMTRPQVIGQVIGQQSNIGDVNGLEALMQSNDIKKLLGKL